MADTQFTAQTYYRAGFERLSLATRLLAAHEYGAAHYFAGIAVESMLRAHALRRGEPFSSNHSVLFWAKQAGLLHTGRRPAGDQLAGMLNEVEARWRANLRYLPEATLVRYLYEAGLYRSIKVNRLKYSAGRLLELAAAIVAAGDARWK